MEGGGEGVKIGIYQGRHKLLGWPCLFMFKNKHSESLSWLTSYWTSGGQKNKQGCFSSTPSLMWSQITRACDSWFARNGPSRDIGSPWAQLAQLSEQALYATLSLHQRGFFPLTLSLLFILQWYAPSQKTSARAEEIFEDGTSIPPEELVFNFITEVAGVIKTILYILKNVTKYARWWKVGNKFNDVDVGN